MNPNLNTSHFLYPQNDLYEKAVELDERHDFQTLVWDLDGTLYQTSAIKRKLFWKWIFNSRFRRDTKELQQRIIQFRNEDDAELNFMQELIEFNSLIATKLSEQMVPQTVMSTLNYFANKNVKQVLITDLPDAGKLASLGCEHFFSDIIECISQFQCLKPSSKLITPLNDIIGPSHFLFIGDRTDTDKALFKRYLESLTIDN
jgi:FMN phosphatase YigB (HAD superfamily)